MRRDRPRPGASIVVTGGTKGIGLGMADAFLARGCKVTIGSRGEEATARALRSLGDKHGPDRVAGRAVDVSEYSQLQALWDLAAERFGRVDVWINNAGTSNPQIPLSEQTPETIAAVAKTNLLGTMNGSSVALRGMRKQGGGALYNMEGYGSDGEKMVGMALYGSTKYAIRYFTRSIVLETRDSPVLVALLSPGVVVTDLLTSVYEQGNAERWRFARWLFKFIADPVEVVSPWLADAVLANDRHGVRLAWMTIPRAVLRFFNPRYHRRELFLPRG
jgi:NAD(P)-dependent dehydrogenase (short-subunit alcohol dehydrogenase family)